MRIFTVTGNLGADAEVLTDKNGGSYIRFRLANHEFGDAENETRWFDVTMFSVPRIAQYLKKGTGVVVMGNYKDSIYNSDKYGAQINRNVTAFNVDFWNSGVKKDENGNPVATPKNETAAAIATEVKTEAATPKAPKGGSKAKTTAAAPAPAPTMPADGEDDLPF